MPGELRVGISRLNPDEGLGKCLAASGLAPRAVAMGASVKHMALARGDLDAVLNLSPAEQEWDTCAPEVILSEAGCTVSDGDGNPMRYNQKDLFRRRGSVASNGLCHPFMIRVMAPCLPEELPIQGCRTKSGARSSRTRPRPADKIDRRMGVTQGRSLAASRQQFDERRAPRAPTFRRCLRLSWRGPNGIVGNPAVRAYAGGFVA